LHNFVDVALIYKQEVVAGLLGKQCDRCESFAMQDFCLHRKSLTSHKS